MKYLFVVFSVYGEETREAWSVRMKTYLMTIDLWDIVEATTEPPAPEDEIAFNAWSKKNAMALYLITESSSKFSDGSAYYVAGGGFVSTNFDSTEHRTAKICWEILEEKLSEERGSYLSFVSQNYAHTTFENKWSCSIGLLYIRHIYQTHNILKNLLLRKSFLFDLVKLMVGF